MRSSPRSTPAARRSCIRPTSAAVAMIVGAGIAVDASGQAYVAGRTKSSNLPTTAGAYQTTYGGGEGDAFVAKFSASGSALIYSTYLGGSGYDVATSIALDPTGNAYVAGYNYAAGFPTTPGAYQTASKGPYDAFITKLNSSGSALIYSTYLGGTGDDYVSASRWIPSPMSM